MNRQLRLVLCFHFRVKNDGINKQQGAAREISLLYCAPKPTRLTLPGAQRGLVIYIKYIASLCTHSCKGTGYKPKDYLIDEFVIRFDTIPIPFMYINPVYSVITTRMTIPLLH